MTIPSEQEGFNQGSQSSELLQRQLRWTQGELEGPPSGLVRASDGVERVAKGARIVSD